MKSYQYLVSIILLLILIQPAKSQSFGGGIYGGLSASQIDGDTYGGYDKAGAMAGVYTYVPLTEKLAAQFEVSFIQKGSRSDDKSPNFYKARLNYVQLPLIAKYNVWKDIYIEGGLAYSYLIDAYEDKDGYGELPADPSFDEYEISGIAGISYYFHDKISVEIRFNYSLLSVRNHPGDQTHILNRGQYNNVICFMITYDLIKLRK